MTRDRPCPDCEKRGGRWLWPGLSKAQARAMNSARLVGHAHHISWDPWNTTTVMPPTGTLLALRTLGLAYATYDFDNEWGQDRKNKDGDHVRWRVDEDAAAKAARPCPTCSHGQKYIGTELMLCPGRLPREVSHG